PLPAAVAAGPAPAKPPVPPAKHPTARRPPPPESSCNPSLEQLAEPRRQRQPEHFLNRTIRLVSVIVFAAPRGQPQKLPVGGPITDAAKTTGVDEGLCEIYRMAVHPFPVVGKLAGHFAQ